MFGYVAGLALPGDGTVVVFGLRETARSRVFDYGGALLTTFGGSGEGPGEFQDRPSRMSVADQGMVVFVLDASGNSVEVFGRQDGSTLVPRVNFQTDLHSHNGCAMGGHYWVYGSNFGSAGVLHKFTFDGERRGLVSGELQVTTQTHYVRLVASGGSWPAVKRMAL